jgi:hypothetical protein
MIHESFSASRGSLYKVVTKPPRAVATRFLHATWCKNLPATHGGKFGTGFASETAFVKINITRD